MSFSVWLLHSVLCLEIHVCFVLLRFILIALWSPIVGAHCSLLIHVLPVGTGTVARGGLLQIVQL